MITNDVTPGSIWKGSDEKRFIVIQLAEADGHTWVHYRQDLGIKVRIDECKEFSCYLESFVQRFRKTVA